MATYTRRYWTLQTTQLTERIYSGEFTWLCICRWKKSWTLQATGNSCVYYHCFCWLVRSQQQPYCELVIPNFWHCQKFIKGYLRSQDHDNSCPSNLSYSVMQDHCFRARTKDILLFLFLMCLSQWLSFIWDAWKITQCVAGLILQKFKKNCNPCNVYF